MTAFLNCQKIIEKIPGAAIAQFLHTCLIEEIKSSNDIEGVHSTRKEILTALSAPEQERSYLRLGGIVNKYVKILQKETIPLNTCQDIRSLYDDFLTDEIKRDDPNNLPDGKIFRAKAVDIVSAAQKTIHRGAYPEEKIIQMMDKALCVLHNPSIPALIRIALFHYFFGYIHPFYDGNGRMDRFITAYLLGKKFHPTIGLRTSILIKKYRSRYYTLFAHTDSAINCGDLTPFIIGTLQLTLSGIASTAKMLLDKYEIYLSCKGFMEKGTVLPIKNRTTRDICDILLQASVFSDIGGASVQEIQQTLSIAENTVYSHLKKIPQEYLKIDKHNRPYRYKFNDVLLQEMNNNGNS